MVSPIVEEREGTQEDHTKAWTPQELEGLRFLPPLSCGWYRVGTRAAFLPPGSPHLCTPHPFSSPLLCLVLLRKTNASRARPPPSPLRALSLEHAAAVPSAHRHRREALHHRFERGTSPARWPHLPLQDSPLGLRLLGSLPFPQPPGSSPLPPETPRALPVGHASPAPKPAPPPHSVAPRGSPGTVGASLGGHLSPCSERGPGSKCRSHPAAQLLSPWSKRGPKPTWS